MAEQPQVKKSSEIVSVSVPLEMKDWLDKHPKVNRSKLFQDAVNSLRFPLSKKVPPTIVLLCMMGIIGGLVITMLSGLIFQILNQILSLGMLLLGLALAIISLLTFMKARKEVRILRQGETTDRI